MASPAFDRVFFSIRGLNAFFTAHQLKFSRPLIGGQLKAQVYSVYPGFRERKEQAYQRVKAAIRAGLIVAEASHGEVIKVSEIPVYGAAGDLPGQVSRRFVYQVRVSFTVQKAGQPPVRYVRSITLQDNETLTREEIEQRIADKLSSDKRSEPGSPPTGKRSEITLTKTSVEWVIRRY